MNSYPMTSTTFIRREMESLEDLGLEIKRYAVRHWDEALVDPLDIAEQDRTHYLLTNNIKSLFSAFFGVLLANLPGFLSSFMLWRKVCKNAGGISIKQFAYLLEATYFYQQTKRDGIEHVHVHFSTNATTVAMLAQAMGGVSYSFTAHGPDEFVDPTLISMGLKIHHAKFVVAISNYCRVQLVRFSSYDYWDKIIIVHCGLKINEFIPSYHFEGSNQDLICVGRLCPQKGQLLIPQALAQLKPEFPNMKVHFIGDGESRSGLEAAIDKYDVRNMVQLHGWKVNSDVRDRVVKSRALLLPSFAEGLPVVIMESLALGRPVISTYIAGIPELVDNSCGWMIPAGSIECIVSAIRNALNACPAILSAMGKVGRGKIEDEHDLKKIAQQLYEKFTA
ncbi:MAG: glycosyltransferase family 4 protein [Methyloglobulus sp.]